MKGDCDIFRIYLPLMTRFDVTSNFSEISNDSKRFVKTFTHKNNIYFSRLDDHLVHYAVRNEELRRESWV